MIKFVVLFFFLFSLIPLIPYGYEQYVVWDARDRRDDESIINQVLDSFTPSISLAEVQQGREIDAGAMFIDVRSEKEYERMHIMGAIWVSEEELYQKIEEIAPNKSTLLYLYDDRGSGGKVSTRLLRGMGYEKAHNIEGGIDFWRKAGFPVEEYLY